MVRVSVRRFGSSTKKNYDVHYCIINDISRRISSNQKQKAAFVCVVAATVCWCVRLLDSQSTLLLISKEEQTIFRRHNLVVATKIRQHNDYRSRLFPIGLFELGAPLFRDSRSRICDPCSLGLDQFQGG
jgi:hypothetical protein